MSSVSLLEDTVTKFGNEVFPEFGWCCILAGGAGSGKGYNFDRYVPIKGRKYDVDHIKDFYFKKMRVVDNYDNGPRLEYEDGKGVKHSIDLDAAGINPPYNTTNTEFTGLLHKITRNFNKALKKFILGGKMSTEQGRLPNVIFDCTLSEESDYTEIINPMKELGYKVAIVYVLTDIDRAINQNYTRGSKPGGRRVDYSTLLNTHSGAMQSLYNLKNRSDIFGEVDDVWAILTIDETPLSKDDRKISSYENKSRPKVVNIKDGDHLDLSPIKDFLSKNLRDIENKKVDYTIASDEDRLAYNEGFEEEITGAYDLWEALNDLKSI